MSDVYHCSPLNSTTFTTCCHVAVITESKCPTCNCFVYPFTDDVYDDDYTEHEVRTMRFSRAHRK